MDKNFIFNKIKVNERADKDPRRWKRPQSGLSKKKGKKAGAQYFPYLVCQYLDQIQNYNLHYLTPLLYVFLKMSNKTKLILHDSLL